GCESIVAGLSQAGAGHPGAGWSRWITGAAPGSQQPLSYGFGSNFFRYIVFGDSGYDIGKLNFDRDVAMTDAKFAGTFSSYAADLSAFHTRGGKLIQYHGWADPAIPARDSIDYYNTLHSRMGATPDFYL